MENLYNHIERIHQYLMGNLSAADKAAFEQELQENPRLAKDLEVERIVLGGIEKAADADARAQVGLMHSQMKNTASIETKSNQPKTRSIMMMNSRALAIAAGIIALIGAVWFMQPSKDPYTEFYKPENTKVKVIMEGLQSYGLAGEITAEDTLLQALKLYDNAQYAEARKALEPFYAQYPENNTAGFYLAMSYLNEANYARAITLLTPLTQKTDFEMRNDAKWYLALCMLKTTDGEKEAIGLFKQLQNEPEFKKSAMAALAMLE